MTAESDPPASIPFPQPLPSVLMVAGNIHAKIAQALRDAGLSDEALLQLTVDPAGKVTIGRPGVVR